ncbi:unnamed protein product [Miscanthus lutarioriparius]|uniref:Uncharacterized protein n=1 Tax=Miscanthus lutarioriparius TaxID=422564 RepID=A0A811QW80_9POAL|nr:unnamed protein product [Miscanthus lutarioriparius]
MLLPLITMQPLRALITPRHLRRHRVLMVMATMVLTMHRCQVIMVIVSTTHQHRRQVIMVTMHQHRRQVITVIIAITHQHRRQVIKSIVPQHRYMPTTNRLRLRNYIILAITLQCPLLFMVARPVRAPTSL